ncbi:FHA domain-containing protein [Myxococcaceae bacterium GXIMD 01537]
MSRIRQTIEVSAPLWRAVELMSRDMGVDSNALVAQALFALARQNGYVAPTVVPMGGEAVAPVETVPAPIVPKAPAKAVVPAAVVESPPPVTPADEAEAPEEPEASDEDAASEDESESEAPSTPASSTPEDPALVVARMKELLAEVEAVVEPQAEESNSEGDESDSDDEEDSDSDDDDSDSDDDDSDSDDSDSDESDDEDSDSDDDADDGEASDPDDEEDSDSDDDSDAEGESDEDSDESDSDDSDDSDEDSDASDSDDSGEEEEASTGEMDMGNEPLPDEGPEAGDAPPETTNIVEVPDALEVFIRLAQGAPVPISNERFIIGRGPKCNLVVKSERVSREHAVVFRDDDEVFIEDLNSSNGTWFGHDRIKRHRISDGDQLMLGSESISFTVRNRGG